jgi:hypothetical protein
LLLHPALLNEKTAPRHPSALCSNIARGRLPVAPASRASGCSGLAASRTSGCSGLASLIGLSGVAAGLLENIPSLSGHIYERHVQTVSC